MVDAGTWTSERSTARYDHAHADRTREMINNQPPIAAESGENLGEVLSDWFH